MISLLLVLPMVMVQGTSLSRVPYRAQLGNENAFLVGGSDAADGAVPSQVSLKFTDGNGHYCGGSIMNRRYILTAAHCLLNMKPGDLKVWAGTNQLNGKGQTYHPEILIPHKGYKPGSEVNDIALIRVTENITMSPRVQPIELNTQYIGAKILMLLSGWGYISLEKSEIPNNMQWVNVTSMSTADCIAAHENSDEPGKAVSDNQVCTKTKKGLGTCLGDSGGPLIVDGKLAGVSSWGIPCGLGLPDVNTRVSKYVKWINGIINT